MNMLYFNRLEELQKSEKQKNLNAYETRERSLYGKHKGHWQWDLAVNWFRMSNDGFFNLYGFNFVPRGRLYKSARSFVHRN